MLTVNICNEGSRIMFILFSCLFSVINNYSSYDQIVCVYVCVCVSKFLRDLLSMDLFTLDDSLLKKQILIPKE